MLYITSSTGVFSYNLESNKISQIMSNKNRSGFFSKRSQGFFGICLDKKANKIIVASREKLGTASAGKPSTDIGLHYIDPLSNTYETIGYVKDIHDIHQIDISGDIVFLSDTGKNRIIAYNIQTAAIVCTLNIGNIRDDINHINAITCHENHVLVSLNNPDAKANEILYLPFSLIGNKTVIDNAYDHADKVQSLSPYTHTHDIEPYKNSFLVCSSFDSIIFDAHTLEPVITINNWVRGIAISRYDIWAGQSMYAKRSKRHSRSIDGAISQINLETHQLEKTIPILGAGQINDLLYINEGIKNG